MCIYLMAPSSTHRQAHVPHSLNIYHTAVAKPTFVRKVSRESAPTASPSTSTEKLECLRRYQAPGKLHVWIPEWEPLKGRTCEKVCALQCSIVMELGRSHSRDIGRGTVTAASSSTMEESDTSGQSGLGVGMEDEDVEDGVVDVINEGEEMGAQLWSVRS